MKNKSPENNGRSKEFYECLWDEIKNLFLASTHKAFLNQELSSSRKQTTRKMLKKKDKVKRFIKIWQPILLLNRDMKIISKVLSTRIKNVLPFLISSMQRAYGKNSFIRKSKKVISNFQKL